MSLEFFLYWFHVDVLYIGKCYLKINIVVVIAFFIVVSHNIRYGEVTYGFYFVTLADIHDGMAGERKQVIIIKM